MFVWKQKPKLILIIFAMLTVVLSYQDASASQVHEGDLIVKGNEIFVIKNSMFIQSGNIVVQDNATLIIDHATLVISQMNRYQYNITIKDNGKLRMIHAKITPPPENYKMYIVYLLDFAQIEITDSSVTGAEGRCYGNSTFISTKLKWPDRGGSGIVFYDHSSLNASYSSLILGFYDFSSAYIEDCDYSIPHSHFISVRCDGNSSVSIINSNVDVFATGFSSVSITNSSILRIYVSESSTVYIKDSLIVHTIGFNVMDGKAEFTLQRGFYAYWNIHKNETVQGINFDITLVNTNMHPQALGWEIQSYGSEVYIFDSDIHNVYVSRSLSDHFKYSNITIIRSSIDRLTATESSSVYVINSTIQNKVQSDRNSLVTLINCYHRSISATRGGVVFVRWYLNIAVTLDDEPLKGATVDVIQVLNNTLIESKFTDNYGIASFLLTEKIIRSDGTKDFKDYIILTTYRGLSNQKQIMLDRSKELSIKLYTPVLSVHCISNNQNLQGVIVKIYDINQNLVRTKKTNSTGWARFKGLFPGEYKISVSLEGYRDKTIKLVLTSSDHIETITLEAISFIETPMVIAIMISGLIAIIILIVIRARKK